MDVGSLPDVIILEIFRHLPYVNLCKAAQVCSRWHRISRDKSLRKIINIRYNMLSWNIIYKFIKHHCTEDLVNLAVSLNVEPHFSQRGVTLSNSTRCLTLLDTCSPNLKYLYLDQSIIRLNLYSCIKYLPKSVTHFSLQANNFHGIFDEFTDEMKRPNVTSLAVGGCTFLTVEYLDFLDCFPNLRELHMDQVDFDDYTLLRCPLIKDMSKTLCILDLESNNEYDGFYLAFDNCVALEQLYLGHNLHAVEDEVLLDGPDLPNLHTLCVVNTDAKKKKVTYSKKFPKLKNFYSGKSKYLCNHVFYL